MRGGRWGLPILPVLAGLALLGGVLGWLQCSGTKAGRAFPRAADRALVDAVWAGDVSAIRRLAADGANVNAIGEHALRPLDVAIGRRQREAFTALLDLGADPSAAPERGSTPLHFAAEFEDGWYLERALAHGASPNVFERTGEGGTPIFTAIDAHQVAAVRALIRAGADVDFMSFHPPATPLMNAIGSGQFEVAYLLVEAGADPRTGNGYVFEQLTRPAFPNAALDPPPGTEEARWKARLLELLRVKGHDLTPAK